jgi:histidinol-phosphate aminotransferase
MSLPKPRPHLLSLAPYPLADRGTPMAREPILLAQNENAGPPSPTALAAASAALAGANRYPDADATPLRLAIAAAEKLDASRIVCSAGSMELIALLAQAYLGPGDEAVASDHGYLFFRTAAALVGADMVLAPERDLGAEVDALLAAVGSRTRMVFLANPNNPTGSLLGRGEVRRLQAGLPVNVTLVLDAAYAEYVTEADYEPGIELVETTANTVMIRTFSKIHGLAGLRVGWGYFPPAIADMLNRVRHPNAVTAPGLAAGAAAIADRGHAAALRDANAERRAWLAGELGALGLRPYPSHGNFLLVSFGSKDRAAAAYQFLKAQGVILRPMAAYGLGECLRVTIGCLDELVALRDELKAWKARG